MVLERGKVMVRTSATLLALAVVLTLIGSATAQEFGIAQERDRKWTFVRSYINTDDWRVELYFGGREIKIDVYVSDATRLSNGFILIEIMEDFAIPAQLGDEAPFHSSGRVKTIDCKTYKQKTSDFISYYLPMGKKGFDRWSDDPSKRATLANLPWHRLDKAGRIKRGLGGPRNRDLFLGDIKRLCGK